MHNKINKIPLCNSTKSGKLINKIINELKPIECIKTNLYDVDYLPTNNEKKISLALDWHNRIEPKLNDIIVLLGAEVHKNYISNLSNKIIKIAHPSSKRSHEAMNEYVLNTTLKIKNIL